jgi:hypothetical protein
VSLLQRDRRVDKGKKYGAVFGRYGFLDGEGGMMEIGDEARVSRRNNDTTAFWMWLTYPESNPKHINTQLTGSQFGSEHLILNVVAPHNGQNLVDEQYHIWGEQLRFHVSHYLCC